MKNIIIFTILFLTTIALYLFLTKSNDQEMFEPLDRTKLYGSLFLDNIDEVIKNMTNPDIKYDTKRMQLFRYYDVLT